ncbi:hypothetical protein OOK36_36980 [Streptomyces sp. NBC_00365]|uniref:hypothetical protein n=1 Tax=Streptomyces sp. NBC_00365 TaxID=2975726 RepID=UPI0022581D81|nr:hypothetical protein [Streptomyces sp. NBC_00365]MCX5094363.1 hypothetical protein [Streptomyces sp. NBC_00365]
MTDGDAQGFVRWVFLVGVDSPGEGCSNTLTPQAAADMVSAAAWRKGFRFICVE